MLSINKKLSKKGFSLIELMVAVVILAMAIFGIFHAYSTGFMGMADARDRTVATNYAQEAMEDIKNMAFDEISFQPRLPIYRNGIKTKFEREVIFDDNVTNLKKVTTNVYRKDRNEIWDKIVETSMEIHFIETTAGTPTRIMLIANPYNVLTEDYDDTTIYENKSIITAVVKDAKGNTVTTYNNNIIFTLNDFNDSSLINSLGETVGKTYSVNAEQGKAIITFQASETEGDITIEAADSGLTPGSVTIKVTDLDKPVKINLTASSTFMLPSSSTLITAEIVNAGGKIVADATNVVNFSVSNLGTLSNQTTLNEGIVKITLTSSGTAGTITITASSTNLEPGIINVYTGGLIYLSASPINVPVNETSIITVTTKDVAGVPIKYNRNISLAVDTSFSTGSGGFPTETTYLVEFNNEISQDVEFTAGSVGEVKITTEDDTPIILTSENELILNIIPELNPDHIKVIADPSSISITDPGAKSVITAWVEDDKFIPIASYNNTITFTTDNGDFSQDGSTLLSESSVDITPDENGFATIYLLPPDDSGTANISVTSVYYEETISGNTRVGFYNEADHIDLIAIPQSILSGGGNEGTCNIIATIKEGANVVSGYDGPVTFAIVEGYPSGVKFTSTNQSSVITYASNGKATVDLQSKNWVGVATIKVSVSEELPELLEAEILIPVVANKNLEIFLLYRKMEELDLPYDFMNYYNPEGESLGNWNLADIIYGKFCVDSDNNLYILDGSCIQKKNSRGGPLLSSDDIGENSYAINIGPNGYIYFTQDTGIPESPIYCINKINPNTLIIEDALYLTVGKIYYGLAVNSDGNIYIHNSTNQTIEKWNFIDGFTELYIDLSYNYEDSELAIAGDYIGGVGVGEVEGERKAFKIPKDFSSSEITHPLTGIVNPLYISSIGEDFLFAGLNADNHVIFGRYDIDGINKWSIPPISVFEYSDCIIGAYPFWN